MSDVSLRLELHSSVQTCDLYGAASLGSVRPYTSTLSACAWLIGALIGAARGAITTRKTSGTTRRLRNIISLLPKKKSLQKGRNFLGQNWQRFFPNSRRVCVN